MKFSIVHQENYSRGELLLRTFLGFFYIVIPHGFLLFFLEIWSAILSFISWWIILFTGKYPQSFFEFQEGLVRWSVRVSARFYNLCDGYPAFGISATDDKTEFNIEYPESSSRGLLLLRIFFGFIYVLIPHGFLLFFYGIWVMILAFIAFWVVLFTGNYPISWHETLISYIRWNLRVTLYMKFMTDVYPPFNGKE
ncbi:MAG: putative transrane protein [Ignavibacteria bacterium]|nr:putative transrane protein [Ignavibacteria bacterium]